MPAVGVTATVPDPDPSAPSDAHPYATLGNQKVTPRRLEMVTVGHGFAPLHRSGMSSMFGKRTLTAAIGLGLALGPLFVNVAIAGASLSLRVDDRIAVDASRLSTLQAGIRSASAPPQPKEPTSPTVVPLGAENPAVDPAPPAQERGQSQFPDLYGGLEVTNDGSRVVVYLTQLNPQVESAIRGSAPASEFTFVRTPHPAGWYDSLTQQISDDDDALKASGVQLIEWGDADLASGRLIVQVLDLTPAKASLLEARYGAGNLLLENGAGLPIVTIGPPRANDSAPWNGGDFITDALSFDCSSGFGAHRAVQYMITAGHCFQRGRQILNGSGGQSDLMHGQLFGNFMPLGPVTSKAGGNLDAEIITTSAFGGSSKLVYAGSSTSSERDAVSGTIVTPRGRQVCQDGAFEGEICGLVVRNSNPICINTPDGRFCHIHKAVNTTGRIAVGQGDSGGPVFRFEGSLLKATGIVTAQAPGGRNCPTYQGPHGDRGRLCSSTLYYTSIQPILSHFRLNINR